MANGVRYGNSSRILAGAVLLAAIAASGAVPPNALQARLDSVEKLIESSSAGRTVEASRLPEACAKRARARELLEQARRLAAEGGEVAAIETLLDEATQSMLAAVRGAKQDDVEDDGSRREYESLTASLDALLGAYVRIRSERAEGQAKDELQRLVEERVAKAGVVAASGDWSAALQELNEAYVSLRAAIDHLRGGKTLVRTLHFETPADEYAYEIDRNDSLRMLVDLLLKDRLAGNARLAEDVATRVSRAEALRRDGEKLAEAERFSDAIGTLEGSTRELVQAIRGAGIYIPQ